MSKKASTKPQLELNLTTTTPAMRASLFQLHANLICPLCNQIFNQPATLTCSHTFCLSCADEYAANNWACPFPGCGLPLSCRGAREGSYLKINPQIQTVVSSLEEITKALNQAPPEWWNQAHEEQEESDDGEEVDFQAKDSPAKSSQESSEEEDCSPALSEQTEAFGNNGTARSDWQMDVTAKQQVDNRSCGLPSQSPNCSPIAIMASQATVQSSQGEQAATNNSVLNESTGKSIMSVDRKETSTVRFQDEVHAMQVDDEKVSAVPSVLVASALSEKDRQLLETFVEANAIELVTSSDGANNDADFALCGNAEMETCDGYLVGRTYGYLLAVARGIPIVNMSYFEAKQTQQDLEPNGDHKHRVIGDVTSSEWMAPQRAIQNKRNNDKQGTSLLHGYTVLLFGDFDAVPKSSSKRSRSGVARKMNEDSQSTYSRERLERLLVSCGATVVQTVESLIEVMDDDSKVAVLIRPNPHPRDWRAACKELQDYPTFCLIRGNWLLDSISDFSAKPFNGYTQQARK